MGATPAGVPLAWAALGPLQVRVPGRDVVIAGERQRLILAALLLNANRNVGYADLVDAVWGEDPPDTARRQVHNAVWRLRRVLTRHGAAGLLRGEPGGYRLCVDTDQVDLLRFESLVAQGRRLAAAGRPEAAAGVLREALALWRGPALDGLAGGSGALGRQAVRLNEARLAVLEEWAELELGCGRHEGLVAQLPAMVAEHPLRERLAAALMLALYRAGRQADALAVFRRTAADLRDELGVDPGPDLRARFQAILRADPGLASPDAAAVVERPAQLPAAAAVFVGRDEHLRELDALVPDPDRSGPAAVVISAIAGTAGVGKTALAVHWAHRVAGRFPDGQLYVNLRGFDPGGRQMTPAEAVRGLLDALGVAPERIPPDLDAQTALYRSLLAGRRMLVVLDNARDADQVRPLLPGAPTALAVVTSRNQLTPLVAAGAHPLALDLLSAVEARDLLAGRLGRERIAAEPAATERIIVLCARLPLALNIAAARAQQTGFPLAAIAAELADAGGRLDALDAGDRSSRVRAVFSWSYAALTPTAARLFRLLGLHPGPDVSTSAAASLAGDPPAGTQRLLTDLARGNLVTEHVPGRYAFHDLLRVYAANLAHRHDTDDDRRAALTRLLDHYVHAAHTADRLLHPQLDPIPVPLAASAAGAAPEHLTDEKEAKAWLTAEHPVLLAAVRRAADAGFDRHTWQLAWAVDTFLHLRGHWDDLVATWRTALDAAHRLGDPVAQAYAHRRLAYPAVRLGNHADAHAHLRQALALYTEAGDPVGRAHTHRSVDYLWWRQGQPEPALDHAQRALALYRTAGHQRGQAHALNAIGWYHTLLGDHTAALTSGRRALAILEQIGDRYGQADAWDSLGYAHHHAGQHAAAVECYQQALARFRDLGNRSNEAETLTKLGESHHAAGDRTAARAAWQDALDILTELDHPDRDTVRTKLRGLDE